MILNLIVALGIGLLIGVERERRKCGGPSRSFAGIRTFTITSLAGATSWIVGGEILLVTATAGMAVLTAAAYVLGRGDDPGLTTEVALVLTVILGGLSMQQPSLAGGLGVTVAVLLAARYPLHHFISSVLTDDELQDALIFAAATLVVLPLVPDRQIGPYGAQNLRSIWILVILIMAISGAGYIAVRMVGARFGLPMAGLASGFISSTATIGAMGARVVSVKALLPAAVAGAVLSTVATIVQMAIVLAATSLTTLRTLTVPLLCAGIAAAVYGVIFHGLGATPEDRPSTVGRSSLQYPNGDSICLNPCQHTHRFGSAERLVRQNWRYFGYSRGWLRRYPCRGISVASLVATGKLHALDATVPILAGLSTNTLSKIFFAAASGERAFTFRVTPGLIVVALAAWAGALPVLIQFIHRAR
jgi:uncharacterized membrane protein (DUF4010 family)